jgi:hypothetical protein
MSENKIKVSASTTSKAFRVNVNTPSLQGAVTLSPDTSAYNANIAEQWAISENIVLGKDYSSKHYANIAKESAENAQNIEEVVKNDYNAFLEASITANSELQATRDNAITEIESNKINAVDSMNAVKNDAVDSINSTKTTILNDIEFVADGEKKEIQDLADEIKDSGNTVNTAIEAGVERLNSIDSLKNNQITNCLLEVPQRIKYELTDGTLTIKAGSVVIVPYGTTDRTSEFPVGSTFINDNFKVYDTQFADGKFFVWAELVGDLSNTNTGYTSTATRLFHIQISANNATASGNTASGTEGYTGSANCLYYFTDKNLVSYYKNGVSTQETNCLPILLVTNNEEHLYSTVNQVFNGMGYIGSTIWVDKGVKGLIPNGRNEDGSLKNIEYTTNSVLTYNNTVLRTNAHLALGNQIFGFRNIVSYDNVNNQNLSGATDFELIADIGLGSADSTGKITSFQPKQPFRAIDYSDKSEVSGWGMPSDKYIDLTLGASGTDYVAPAHGWVYLRKATGKETAYITLINLNNNIQVHQWSTGTNSQCAGYLPVKKGDKFRSTYNATGKTNEFKFIYAEGEV